jgi:hypothetical protein
MSRNSDSVFTDVFSYPVSKQQIQMTSFYDNVRTQVKPHQYPHAFGHTAPAPPMKAPNADIATYTTANSSTSPRPGNLNTTTTGVALPPLRRVVKLSVSPIPASLAVVSLAVINTILCMVIPTDISPIIGTLWGSFLYLWLFITMLQLISHSVYLCTPMAMLGSSIHLFVVVTAVVLTPRSLFAKWLWLAPSLCVVIVAHQSQLICLVYTHVRHQWMYAVVGCVLVLLPMTQVIQIDATEQQMISTTCIWSAISIYTLYGFALANSRGAVLVDLTVGASPTWQLQE